MKQTASRLFGKATQFFTFADLSSMFFIEEDKEIDMENSVGGSQNLASNSVSTDDMNVQTDAHTGLEGESHCPSASNQPADDSGAKNKPDPPNSSTDNADQDDDLMSALKTSKKKKKKKNKN